MIGAHLAEGRDVVLPQMLVDPNELARYHAALEDLVHERPNAVVVQSVEGAVEETFGSLLESLT